MRKILYPFIILFCNADLLHAQCDAAFTYSVNNNKVSFTASHTGNGIKHSWLFGDGTADYYSSATVHTYYTPGNYTILHTVRDSANSCVDSAWQTINLNFTPTCAVNFTYLNLPGSGNEYIFYPQVSIIGSSLQQITWTINGVQASTEEVFKTSFSGAASYNVCVTIEAASGCTAQKCQTIEFTPYTYCGDSTSFTYTIDSIQTGRVNFMAAPNQPQLKYYWYFGDGGTGWDSMVSHTYTAPGIYTTTLIVKDSISHCIDSLSKNIAIAARESEACTASFTNIVNPQGQVAFTATSNQSIVTQTWTIFSADSAYHTVLNAFDPVHTFTDTGWYFVWLAIVTDTGCTASYRDTIRINSLETGPSLHCGDSASFSYNADPVQTRQVNFIATPNQPQLKYHWDFGDGGLGWNRVVSHTYASPGVYTTILIVKDSINGCIDTLSKNIEVVAPESERCTVFYTKIVNQHGQVAFTATSNQSIVSQTWKIFSVDSLHHTVLNSANPVYNFPATGLYFVCLEITTNTGCTASYCDSVRINLITGGRPAIISSYPNPVSAEAFVRLNIDMKKAGMISYKVCNLAGINVYQSQKEGQRGANIISIPVQQLQKGQYFIDIVVGTEHSQSIFQKL
jgi:PKD repeat protein